MQTPELIIKLIDSSKVDWITPAATLIAALCGSLFTLLFFWIQRMCQKSEEKNVKKEKRIYDLNTLLIQLADCIYDTKQNIDFTNGQKDFCVKNYEGVDYYEAYNGCDAKLIKESSLSLTRELPTVVYMLNGLENKIKETEVYRNERNNLIKDKNPDNNKYTTAIEDEIQWSRNMLNDSVVPSILVIYDYAVSTYGKEYSIFDIKKRQMFSDIWAHLDEDDFTIEQIQNLMQYEFKNKELLEWFFKEIKEEYEKDKAQKDTEENKDAE